MPPSDQSPSLIEFCEPFFNEVGNIMRYSGYAPDSRWQVRNLLKARLDELNRLAAGSSASLAQEYQSIKPVLAFFADDVIGASTLPFADYWRGELLLASDPEFGGIVDGQVRFFLLLDAALPLGATAAPRLEVFQTCLGLGFGGIHRDDRSKLGQYSSMILQQLNLNMGGSTRKTRICEDAYESTQDSVLMRPVNEKVIGIAIVGGALLLATIVSYICIYVQARDDINSVLGQIISKK